MLHIRALYTCLYTGLCVCAPVHPSLHPSLHPPLHPSLSLYGAVLVQFDVRQLEFMSPTALHTRALNLRATLGWTAAVSACVRACARACGRVGGCQAAGCVCVCVRAGACAGGWAHVHVPACVCTRARVCMLLCSRAAAPPCFHPPVVVPVPILASVLSAHEYLSAVAGLTPRALCGTIATYVGHACT